MIARLLLVTHRFPAVRLGKFRVSQRGQRLAGAVLVLFVPPEFFGGRGAGLPLL